MDSEEALDDENWFNLQANSNTPSIKNTNARI